jgi:hypothetical protein
MAKVSELGIRQKKLIKTFPAIKTNSLQSHITRAFLMR